MSFTVLVSATEDQIDTAKSKIRGAGGSVSGNSFNVKGVEGRMSRDGDRTTITITDKPWLASEGMIKDEIRKFFR